MMRNYNQNPEEQQERKKREYNENPVEQQERKKREYKKEKEAITSLEALQKFHHDSIHSPIFPCLFCAEYNFRRNTYPVDLAEFNPETRKAHMDESYRLINASKFRVLDCHWVCVHCWNQLNLQKLPARSTANIPVTKIPKQFRDLSDVENCLVAPLVVFVKIHKLKNQLSTSNKVVALPVSRDRVFENLRSLPGHRLDSATIIRSAEFDKTVYAGQVRSQLLKDFVIYIMYKGYRHYGSQDQAAAIIRELDTMNFQEEDLAQSPLASADEPTHQARGDQVVYEVDQDAVERQRVKLDCVESAFLPNSSSPRFTPTRDSAVTNMMNIKDPYSQMFPSHFPSGKDIDDNFRISVTEIEWVNHHIRGIDPWFSNNAVFLFTAAYRVGFQKVAASIHAVKGKSIHRTWDDTLTLNFHRASWR